MAASSTPADKVFYLENDKQRFWELTVCGAVSIIRYGKVGCKGRRCSAKSHDSPARCRQWSVIQANAKRFEGYEEPAEKDLGPSPLKRRLTSIHAERLGLSRQETLPIEYADPPTLSRKPSSIPLAKQKTLSNEPPRLTRRSTTLQTSQSIKRHVSAKKATVEKRQWRKPPRKQSTIRNLASQMSSTEKAQDWRRPHKKQITVRALGKVISYAQRAGPFLDKQVSNVNGLGRKQSTIRRTSKPSALKRGLSKQSTKSALTD